MLSKHFTLVLFIPVISAIAGNIGLQTSSSVTSFLNLRQMDKKPFKVQWLLRKYILLFVLRQSSSPSSAISSSRLSLISRPILYRFQTSSIIEKKGRFHSCLFDLSLHFAHCFIQMLILSGMMGALAFLWRKDDSCKHSYGLIVLVGSMVNMMIASVAGVGMWYRHFAIIHKLSDLRIRK